MRRHVHGDERQQDEAAATAAAGSASPPMSQVLGMFATRRSPSRPHNTAMPRAGKPVRRKVARLRGRQAARCASLAAGGGMRRRHVLMLSGLATGAAAAGDGAERANAPPRHPCARQSDPVPMLREVREGLRALGYVEGQTIVFDLRNAHGDPALMQRYALRSRRAQGRRDRRVPDAGGGSRKAGHHRNSDRDGAVRRSGPQRPGRQPCPPRRQSSPEWRRPPPELGGKNLELLREVSAVHRAVSPCWPMYSIRSTSRS